MAQLLALTPHLEHVSKVDILIILDLGQLNLLESCPHTPMEPVDVHIQGNSSRVHIIG
jgi:hypothetical protein